MPNISIRTSIKTELDKVCKELTQKTHIETNYSDAIFELLKRKAQ